MDHDVGKWRLCRVLANKNRLKMFGLIARRPGQTVSVIARAVNVTVSAASQYLRTFEAAGFLHTRRQAGWVECWPLDGNKPPSGEAAARLANALRDRLEGDKNAIAAVFRLLTAFTHPRRVEIYRALQPKGLSLGQLRTATGIAAQPLLRHLHKLQARGFVVATANRPRRYAAARHPDVFGRALSGFVAGTM